MFLFLPTVQDLFLRLSSLATLTWFTYLDALKGGWLIDDTDGIASFDGIPQWKLPRTHDHYAPFNFHTLLRIIRWHAGKRPNPNRDWKKDKQPSLIPYPKAHHRFNFWLTSASMVLLYLFLSQLFDSNLAWFAVALFIVHPIGCQTIAWMSGIGYCLSLFFMLIGMNLALLTQGWMSTFLGSVASVLLVGLFQGLAIQSQFAQMAATAIYAYLGFWLHACISAILATTVCRPILQDAVVLRMKVFKAQQMEASTKFHLRKIIVAFKTLYYYTKMSLFPKRLGLYHTYGYHFEIPYIEAPDRYFYFGVATFAAWLAAFFLGPAPVQLGALWYIAFLFLFLNWITIHQFVSERYNWIPTFGVCLIVTWILYSSHLLWLWFVLFGILIMRTWAHLPTFLNEIQFYQSNIWNFPNSEVAVGNLGVAYTKIGLTGSAHDMWLVGTRINPEYDVNWYNLYSVYRANHQIEIASQHLARSLSCRSCHFQKDWVDEMYSINREVERMKRQSVGFTVPSKIGLVV